MGEVVALKSGIAVPRSVAQQLQAEAFGAGYTGASRNRDSMRGWTTGLNAANADEILRTDLHALRTRSHDLVRNNPMAGGAINTVCTSVVGSGLKVQARIDRKQLGMTEEQAEEWENTVEREFKLFATSKEFDRSGALNFYESQDLVLRSEQEAGDIFALMLHQKKRNNPYGLQIQLIEGDRVGNPNNKRDTKLLTQGVKKDRYGAPIGYYIAESASGLFSVNRKWHYVRAFGGRTGRRNVLHLYRMKRPGQSRGAPYLAPVIESLKELGTFTEAELAATVVAGMQTTFVTTPTGDAFGDTPIDEYARGRTDYYKDRKPALQSGAVIGLYPGDTVENPVPGRPNTAFDGFVLAISRQIGAALEIPFEILVKHFTASYSAARAALEQAWQFYRTRREWMSTNYCQPIYETFLEEAVALGRISAPGFFNDPLIRQAYCGAEWIGPSKPQIDTLKENKADEIAEDRGWKTAQQNTIERDGGDWDRKHERRAKEHRMRKESGMELPSYKDDPALLIDSD